MLCFIPQSIATMVGLSPPWLYVGSLVDTGPSSSVRIHKTTSLGEGGAPSTSSRPRTDPLSLVSALVSTPKIAGTPALASQLPKLCCEAQCDGSAE